MWKNISCAAETNKNRKFIIDVVFFTHQFLVYGRKIEENETHNNSNHQFYDAYEEKLERARRGENKNENWEIKQNESESTKNKNFAIYS